MTTRSRTGKIWGGRAAKSAFKTAWAVEPKQIGQRKRRYREPNRSRAENGGYGGDHKPNKEVGKEGARHFPPWGNAFEWQALGSVHKTRGPNLTSAEKTTRG